MSHKISIIAVEGIPLVAPGDDIPGLIVSALSAADETLVAGDVLVIAQKIVSKAENRYVNLSSLNPSSEALALAKKVDKDPRLVELILQESVSVVRHRPGLLIVEHPLGFIHANAGIDQSNIESEDIVLLLPEDPDASASAIRSRLMHHFNVPLAVIINDTSGRPWRTGVTGFAIGSSGINPVTDLRGTRDLFGREFKVTEVATVDELATAASILMGQGNEGIPVVIIRGAPYEPGEEGARILIRDPADDLFRDW